MIKSSRMDTQHLIDGGYDEDDVQLMDTKQVLDVCRREGYLQGTGIRPLLVL